jgi:hypothetical protein
MLDFLRGRGVARSKGGRRKLRLLACGCCRRLWPLLGEPARHSVEAAERLADSLAVTPKRVIWKEETHWDYNRWAAQKAARAAARSKAAEAARLALSWASGALARDPRTPGAVDQQRWAESEAYQCALLRDLFGNPFCPTPNIDPAWLAWNHGTVRRLAEAACQERLLPQGTLDPGRLAVLADGLEESGCAETELLGHLRGPGPHVLGCWCVDAILGRE